MKVPFIYYLHDEYSHAERVEWIQSQTGVEFTEEMHDNLGRPFYEVGLKCELDSETGEVTLLGVQL